MRPVTLLKVTAVSAHGHPQKLAPWYTPSFSERNTTIKPTDNRPTWWIVKRIILLFVIKAQSGQDTKMPNTWKHGMAEFRRLCGRIGHIYIYWIGTCQHIEWFCSYGNQMYAPGKRVAANLMPKNHVLESFTCFEIPRTFKFTNTLTYSDYVCVFTPYVWQTKAPLGGKGGAQVPNLKTYSMAMSGTDWLEVPTIYIYISIYLSIYPSIYLSIYIYIKGLFFRPEFQGISPHNFPPITAVRSM